MVSAVGWFLCGVDFSIGDFVGFGGIEGFGEERRFSGGVVSGFGGRGKDGYFGWG